MVKAVTWCCFLLPLFFPSQQDDDDTTDDNDDDIDESDKCRGLFLSLSSLLPSSSWRVFRFRRLVLLLLLFRRFLFLKVNVATITTTINNAATEMDDHRHQATAASREPLSSIAEKLPPDNDGNGPSLQ